MIKDYCGSLYGNYRQYKFTDVYDNADDFVADYKDNGFPTTIKDDSANVLFYLLYSRYGNNTIASSDLTRFKYKMFGTVWQYGPTWEKKLDIQKMLREYTEEQILAGEGYTSESDNTVTSTTSGQKSSTLDKTGSGNKTSTTDSETNTTTSGTNNTTTTTDQDTTDSTTTNTSGTTTSNGTKLKNYADNPGTEPSTTADTPLTYINRQEYEKTATSGTDTSTSTVTGSGTLDSTVTTNGTTSGTEKDTVKGTVKDTYSDTGKDTLAQNDSSTRSDTGKDTLKSSKTKGKLEAYAMLWNMLKDDVTTEFISRFKPLFLTVVQPEEPLYYITEDSEE